MILFICLFIYARAIEWHVCSLATILLHFAPPNLTSFLVLAIKFNLLDGGGWVHIHSLICLSAGVVE